MYDCPHFGFHWLYQTNSASKDRLGAVLSQKHADGWYHPVAYGSRTLMPHEKNYHFTMLEFLALKWVVTEHFKEYLPYQPFLVKNKKTPLTYIMMTPNLNANGHWWVRALVRFNFQLEYQKGHDNTVADVSSWVTTCLYPDMVRSVLDEVTLGAAHLAEVHNPTIVDDDHCSEHEVCVASGCALVQMHITDWIKGRSSAVCSFRLVGNTEEDRFESTSGKACLWWEWLTDLAKSKELHDSSERLIPVLYAQGQEWRPSAFPSPKSTSGHCSVWMPWGCRTSGLWLHSVPVVGMLLVARIDQSDVTIHQDLCTLLATWGWLVQGSFTPYCGHHSSGPLPHRFYQHRDDLGAEQVT